MKRLERYLVSVALSLLAHTVAAQGIVYLSDPDPSALTVGDTFTIEVRGKDFPVALDGGGVNVAFSNGWLELLDLEIGAEWDFALRWNPLDAAEQANKTQKIDAWNQAGEASDLWFNTSSMAGVEGDFLIAALSFGTTQSGTADITPEPNGTYVFGRFGQQIDPDEYIGGQVTIASLPIPEPTTWATLMVGVLLLLTLPAVRRRCG